MTLNSIDLVIGVTSTEIFAEAILPDSPVRSLEVELILVDLVPIPGCPGGVLVTAVPDIGVRDHVSHVREMCLVDVERPHLSQVELGDLSHHLLLLWSSVPGP